MARTQTYTIKEAAQILGVCLSTAYEAAKRGEIPVITIGGTKRVPRLALEEMLRHGDDWRTPDGMEGRDGS